jgi:excisionase family DNA binding protein
VSDRIALTTKQAAAELGISPGMLRKAVAAGLLPPPRAIGRSVRFIRSELEQAASGLPVANWRTSGEGEARLVETGDDPAGYGGLPAVPVSVDDGG